MHKSQIINLICFAAPDELWRWHIDRINRHLKVRKNEGF